MSDSNKKGDFASPNSDESCTSTDNGKDDFSQSDILSELYSGLDDSIEKGSDATINTDVFSDSRVIFEDLVVKSKSKYKTRAEVMNIINVITHWDTGTVDLPGVTEFRKAHKKGYYWVSHFQVLSKKLENRTIKELHVRKSSSGTRIVPIEEIFDIILKCHVDGAVHQKVRRTYNYIKKTYFNISEKMVDIFISNCCTICNMKIKPQKSLKGASNPIKSLHFRARFQADLIDYRHDPRIDHNGVKMRWLLVTKDHFTKKCWLQPDSLQESRTGFTRTFYFVQGQDVHLQP